MNFPRRVTGKPILVPPWIFFTDRAFKGWWVRTHVSVIQVDCPFCGAVAGQLCMGIVYQEGLPVKYSFGEPIKDAHNQRRKAAKGLPIEVVNPVRVIAPNLDLPHVPDV